MLTAKLNVMKSTEKEMAVWRMGNWDTLVKFEITMQMWKRLGGPVEIHDKTPRSISVIKLIPPA